MARRKPRYSRKFRKASSAPQRKPLQGKVSADGRIFRNYPENWADIRREVFGRDDYTCQHCGSYGGILHCHHKDPQGSDALSNLLTLCESCHIACHPHMQGEIRIAVGTIRFFPPSYEGRSVTHDGNVYTVSNGVLYDSLEMRLSNSECQRFGHSPGP